MSHATSPFAERRYGVVRVTREWEMARSSFYDQLRRAAQPERALRRHRFMARAIAKCGRGCAFSRCARRRRVCCG